MKKLILAAFVLVGLSVGSASAQQIFIPRTYVPVVVPGYSVNYGLTPTPFGALPYSSVNTYAVPYAVPVYGPPQRKIYSTPNTSLYYDYSSRSYYRGPGTASPFYNGR